LVALALLEILHFLYTCFLEEDQMKLETVSAEEVGMSSARLVKSRDYA